MTRSSWVGVIGCLAGALLASPAASAATILTFEGLADTTAVPSGFYSGLGITSITNATSFIAFSAGGSVPFANMPSANTAILAASTGAIFNLSGGFTSSATVFYSANGSFNAVQVFSGLNGTGSLLGSSATFVDNRSTCNAGVNPGDPACWTLATVNWAGTAQSILLPGNAGSFFYDNLSLNVAASGVPEPASAGLVGAALFACAVFLRRRAHI